jgi:F-type H+-transporting ATPase subunit epsilon
MNLKIVTPERLVLEKQISQVTIPTKEGEITILENHIPLVGIINSGVLTIKEKGDREEVIAILGGFFRVGDGEVEILADNAEKGEEIDLVKVQEAKERAENALVEARSKEEVDYTRLQVALERELARLKTAKKHRSHHGINLD